MKKLILTTISLILLIFILPAQAAKPIGKLSTNKQCKIMAEMVDAMTEILSGTESTFLGSTKLHRVSEKYGMNVISGKDLKQIKIQYISMKADYEAAVRDYRRVCKK